MTHFIGPVWDPPATLDNNGKTYHKMLDIEKDPETAEMYGGTPAEPYEYSRWRYYELYTEGKDIYQRAAFARDSSDQVGSPNHYSGWPESGNGDPIAVTHRYYALNIFWPRFAVDELLLVIPMTGSQGWDDGVTFWRQSGYTTDFWPYFFDPIPRPNPAVLEDYWQGLSGPCVEILRGGDNNWNSGGGSGGWKPENNPDPVTDPATDADLEWDWTIPPRPIPIQSKAYSVDTAVGRYVWTYADSSNYDSLVKVPVKVDPAQNFDYIQFYVYQYAGYDNLAFYDPTAGESISNHIPYIYYLPAGTTNSVEGQVRAGDVRSGARQRRRPAVGARKD